MSTETSMRFKRQADATKWLKTVSGCFLEESSSLGKWAAYVPPLNVNDDMIIGYGETPTHAISVVYDLFEEQA